MSEEIIWCYAGSDGRVYRLTEDGYEAVPEMPACPNCGQAVREGSRHGETHHGSGGEHTICVSEPLVEPARPALETGHG